LNLPDTGRVHLLAERLSRPIHPDGPVASVQEADLELDEEMSEPWQRPSMEHLACAYWAYLRAVSRGLLRVVHARGGPSVVLAHPRLVLLRFRPPHYDLGPGFGQVTWPIERGLLVAAPGRGRLRFAVRRIAPGRVRVRAEVENFYPLLRGRGGFARIGVRLYALTQLRVHMLVTSGFLRSLAHLDLPAAGSRGAGRG
jgi:hypothetical protein